MRRLTLMAALAAALLAALTANAAAAAKEPVSIGVAPSKIQANLIPGQQYKTDLDVLRFAHFLALAAITVRFVPAGWPGLSSPWLRPMVLCGQHSLEIFALGVFLAFSGYFVLMETSAGLGMHILIGLVGITIMSSVAWMLSWYKRLR